MPNIAKAFKDEVIRLARKEAKSAVAPIRKPAVAFNYRRDVSPRHRGGKE